MAWDDLPTVLGCGKTCRNYLQVWHQVGVWQKLYAVLLAEFSSADLIDRDRAIIDATFENAEGREDPGPNPTDRIKLRSMHGMMADAQDTLGWSPTVTLGNVNEITQDLDVLLKMSPVGDEPVPQREKHNQLFGHRAYDL